MSDLEFPNFSLSWEKLNEMMGRMRERLRALRVEAAAGGGMVTAVADGTGRLLQVRWEPQLLQQGDAEMLSDLVVAAVNAVQEKARQAVAEELNQLAPFPLPFDPGQLF